MLRWICLIATVLIVLMGVIEYVWEATPLQQLRGDFGALARDDSVTVIRVGIAAWQMREFPWEDAIRRFEAEHPDTKIAWSLLPEDSFNMLLLCWRHDFTYYDCVVAFADEEIHPYIEYNWHSPDPSKRGLLVDVTEYLADNEMAAIVPGFWPGSARVDPDTGKRMCYEIPWMGEVMALNYNRQFFKRAGIDVPTTWGEVERVGEKLKGLKNKDGQEVAPLGMYFAQKFPWFIQNCYLGLLAEYRAGKGILDKNGRLIIDGPEAVRVLKTLKRWYDNGIITDLSFNSSELEHALSVRRTAMYRHWQSRGLWAVKDLGADVIGIAATPGAKLPAGDRKVGSLVSTYGCIFPKCSPVKEQAIRACYKMFCTDDYGFQSGVSKGFPRHGELTGGGKMPAITAIYDDPDLPEAIVTLGEVIADGYPMPDPVNMKQCTDIMVVEFQKYIRGKTKTAEEVLEIVRRRYAEEVYADK